MCEWGILGVAEPHSVTWKKKCLNLLSIFGSEKEKRLNLKAFALLYSCLLTDLFLSYIFFLPWAWTPQCCQPLRMAGLCYLKILPAGPICSEFLPFTTRERHLDFSTCSFFDQLWSIAFFKDLKSNINANLFYRSWKKPWRLQNKTKQKFMKCMLSLWASRPRLSYI